MYPMLYASRLSTIPTRSLERYASLVRPGDHGSTCSDANGEDGWQI